MAKKKIPKELDQLVKEVQNLNKELKEEELLIIPVTKREGLWDYPLSVEIKFFDPLYSYEITGYRPINETLGLDFDPNWFIGTRKVYEQTGKYCQYLFGSKKFREFWREEYRRCKNGYTVNGYTITGDHYFFLNFYQLPLVDKVLKAGGGRPDGFPNFSEALYQWFHYYEMSKRVRMHCNMMKARGIGFSEINASMSACMFTIIRLSVSIIACHDAKKMGDTLKKVWHSMAFLDNETGGGMHKNKQLKNTDTEKQAGEYIQQNGNKIPTGWLAIVRGINADDPLKIRGDRADLLILDEAGCHISGTKVLMFDGSIKNVEDINIGDTLMGPDGTVRNVIELHSGTDLMYKIIMDNKEELIVNSKHIIYGKKYDYNKKTFTDFAIHAEDFYNMVEESPRKRDGYKLIKATLDFPKLEVPIDPYIFGYWLGDGDASKARFTSKDPEVIQKIELYALENGSQISKVECGNSKDCYHITILKRDGEYTNWFVDKLKQLGVFNNKHIPICYKFNDTKTRLKVLAGLIDSDGSYNSEKHTVEITQFEGHKPIIDDTLFVCRSLGLKVTLSTRVSKQRVLDKKIIKGDVLQYRIRILYGHSQIPTLIPRKLTVDRNGTGKGSINKLAYSFKIEKVLRNTYYGFSLDKDLLFLLEDFTVCHNSWPNLKKAFIQGEALVNIGGERFGIIVVGGTGGDSGANLEGLKDIYYHPEAYDVLPYKHRYTQTGEEALTGFFIPAFALVWEFVDHRGYCNKEKAKAKLLAKRDKFLNDPEGLILHCAEYCWNAEEAFNLEGNNKFNRILITDLLAEIRLHKRGPRPERGNLEYIFKTGKQTKENIDGFKWTPNNNSKLQILEHPIWSNEFKHSPTYKYYDLETIGTLYKEMKDLYIAGVDGIDIGANDTSKETRNPSDFCIVILKRMMGMQEPLLVAMYKDRPGDEREAYKIAIRLCLYYNAKINIEATRKSFYTWSKDKGYGNFFVRRPKMTMTSELSKTLSNQIGTPATKQIIDLHTTLTAHFVEDYCHTIWFEEILQELMSYNDENKTKFDIVASLGMVFLLDQELSLRVPSEVVKEVKEFEDFGYYTDEHGYKRWGVIPKADKTLIMRDNRNEYDPRGIDSSDPRHHLMLA